MYAFDENSKLFETVLTFSSKNNSPIVFYKLNRHMYIIDDKSIIKSVAEMNKKDATKIISLTIDEETKKENTRVFAFFVFFDFDADFEPDFGVDFEPDSEADFDLALSGNCRF